MSFLKFSDVAPNPVQILNSDSESVPAATERAVENVEVQRARDMVVYRAEKHYGKRRRASGEYNLKTLKQRHYQIVALHLQGKSAEVISLLMNCSLATVYRVLGDPQVKPILQQVYGHRQQEIDALAGHAIDAVRSGMESEITETRLKAVDRYIKIKEHLGSSDTAAATAEEIVSKIFERATINGDVNVQVNIGDSGG